MPRRTHDRRVGPEAPQWAARTCAEHPQGCTCRSARGDPKRRDVTRCVAARAEGGRHRFARTRWPDVDSWTTGRDSRFGGRTRPARDEKDAHADAPNACGTPAQRTPRRPQVGPHRHRLRVPTTKVRAAFSVGGRAERSASLPARLSEEAAVCMDGSVNGGAQRSLRGKMRHGKGCVRNKRQQDAAAGPEPGSSPSGHDS